MIEPILIIADIFQQVQVKKQVRPISTIGCVLDVSRPIFRQKSKDYILEIKLADQSLKQPVAKSLLIDHLSIYLISQNKQQLKFSWKIGDFIYLHKFVFCLWRQIHIFTKYSGSFECLFQIQSGKLQETNEFTITKRLGVQLPNIDRGYISARIVQMKNWLMTNFTNIFNPFLGIKIITNYCCSIQPFCLTLKIHKIQEKYSEQQRYTGQKVVNLIEKQLILVDNNNNLFYADVLQLTHVSFKINQWVFVKGIKYINTDFRIILTKYGNILNLPQIFAKNYQNTANFQAIYQKTNTINQKRQSTDLTQISVIDQPFSTVKQLFDLQDKYQGTSKKEDINLQNYYLVKGAVVRFKGKIKLYHTEYQMIIHDKYLDQISAQQKNKQLRIKK